MIHIQPQCLALRNSSTGALSKYPRRRKCVRTVANMVLTHSRHPIYEAMMSRLSSDQIKDSEHFSHLANQLPVIHELLDLTHDVLRQDISSLWHTARVYLVHQPDFFRSCLP